MAMRYLSMSCSERWLVATFDSDDKSDHKERVYP